MIAITGSRTGFLSSKLLDLPDVVSIPRAQRTDFLSLVGWINTHNPSCVIHCAGLADVRMCMDYPQEAIRVNTIDTITLVNALDNRNISLIYVATDKVFGNQRDCTIATPYQPISAYDVSKVAAEMVIEKFSRNNRCILARFPNFFGPGDPHTERLFPSVVEAIKTKKEKFVVRTTSASIRQYIFIQDVVDILSELVKLKTERFKHHFGTPHLRSVHQVIENLCNIFDWQMDIEEQGLGGEATQLSLLSETNVPFQLTDWDTSLRSFL